MRAACAETLFTLLGLNLLCHVFSAADASAKRGCSAFGHSCFGGHGKRFDPEAMEVGAGAAAAMADILDDQTTRDRDRDRNNRDQDLGLLASIAAPRDLATASGNSQNILKALMDCQAIKQMCVTQAIGVSKIKRPSDTSSYNTEFSDNYH
ncbi:uncharacterized protein [Bemisia tabaci]|uniref:uncharacterized protein n=1 Tax=Bemisia tabaci TaxID=7038 RepID=UPI0008F9AB09|nr:PREDICTED: uncharacterized protein LOC109044454 [Bemisia tabaci]